MNSVSLIRSSRSYNLGQLKFSRNCRTKTYFSPLSLTSRPFKARVPVADYKPQKEKGKEETTVGIPPPVFHNVPNERDGFKAGLNPFYAQSGGHKHMNGLKPIGAIVMAIASTNHSCCNFKRYMAAYWPVICRCPISYHFRQFLAKPSWRGSD